MRHQVAFGSIFDDHRFTGLGDMSCQPLSQLQREGHDRFRVGGVTGKDRYQAALIVSQEKNGATVGQNQLLRLYRQLGDNLFRIQGVCYLL